MIKQYVINYRLEHQGWNHLIVETNHIHYIEDLIPEDWIEYEVFELKDEDTVDLNSINKKDIH